MSTWPIAEDNYPTNRSETDPQRLAGQDVDEAFDAINKLQEELGLAPSGAHDTVADAIAAALAGGGGGGSGHTIKSGGTPLTQRTGLNFSGAVTVTDDAVNDETDVAIDAAPLAHDHDDRYYTETEADAQLAAKADDADLTAHVTDDTDAHAASAITVTPAGTIAATTVQAALEEIAAEAGGGGGSAHTVKDDGTPLTQRAGLNFSGSAVTVTDDAANDETDVVIDAASQGDLDAHINDAADAHDASAISVAFQDVTWTATDVENALAQLRSLKASTTYVQDHIINGGHPANLITIGLPISGLAATEVRAALAEILSERSGSGKGFVNHGATAGTARPAGYASVEWVGSVEPTNAIDGDTWIDTA